MRIQFLLAVSMLVFAAGCGCVNTGGQLIGRWSGVKEGSGVLIEFLADKSTKMTFTFNPGAGESVIQMSGQYKTEGEYVEPDFKTISVEKSPITWEQDKLEQLRKQLNQSMKCKIEWKDKDQVVFKSPEPGGVDLTLRREK